MYFLIIYIEMDLELTVINCDTLMYSTVINCDTLMCSAIMRCILCNFTRPLYQGLQFGNENFDPVGSSEHEMAHLKNSGLLNRSLY
jgi:hypothetical protein